MRWAALGVDYEMAGKDLIDSVRLSGQICRILGAQQPEGFNYELFLDEKGEKISKSRGNGLTIEEWLTYACPESLSLYMFQSPRKAKRLYFDVIPRAVDEYVGHLAAYPKEEPAAQADEPGLAHPSGRAAAGRASDQLRAAAQSGQRLELRGQRGAVGLHPALRARRDAGSASAARSARRLRHPLLP